MPRSESVRATNVASRPLQISVFQTSDGIIHSRFGPLPLRQPARLLTGRSPVLASAPGALASFRQLERMTASHPIAEIQTGTLTTPYRRSDILGGHPEIGEHRLALVQLGVL